MEENRRELRRRDDVERDELLRERREQIDRLSERVQSLLTDRVTVQQYDGLQRNQADLGRSLQRLEIALFGATGDNGINSAVKQIQVSVTGLDNKLDARFDALHEADREGLRERLSLIGKWALGIITTLLVVGGGLAAAVISSH